MVLVWMWRLLLRLRNSFLVVGEDSWSRHSISSIGFVVVIVLLLVAGPGLLLNLLLRLLLLLLLLAVLSLWALWALCLALLLRSRYKGGAGRGDRA